MSMTTPFPTGALGYSTPLDGVHTPSSYYLLSASPRTSTMSPTPRSGVNPTSGGGLALLPNSSFFDDAIEAPDLPPELAMITSTIPPSHAPTSSSKALISETTREVNSPSQTPSPKTRAKAKPSSRRSTSRKDTTQSNPPPLAPETIPTTPMAELAKPKKRGRKPKAPTRDSSADFDDDDLDEDGLPRDPRRRRVLERNRIAATKCRLRKRDEASDLASREHAMEDQNRYLASCYDSLTAEIYHLKEQLLRHTDCNCVLIQKYIAHEAKKSVENMVGSSSSGMVSEQMGYFNRGSSHMSSSESLYTGSDGDSVRIPWAAPFPSASCQTTPMGSAVEPPFEEYHGMPMAMDHTAPMPPTITGTQYHGHESQMMAMMGPDSHVVGGGVVWGSPWGVS